MEGGLRGIVATTSRKASERGLHHSRVEGMRRFEARECQARRRQPGLQRVDGSVLARNDALRFRVDGGEVELAVQKRPCLASGRSTASIEPVRLRLHQPAALGDEPQRVVERETAAEARRDVLADAVADHRVRRDAPVHQQSRERVLDDEEGRLRQPRLAKKIGPLVGRRGG